MYGWSDPRTKPPPGTPVNPDQPLGEGLVYAFMLDEGAGNSVRNAAADNAGAFTGTTLPVRRGTPYGNGVSFPSGGTGEYINVPAGAQPLARGTVAILHVTHADFTGATGMTLHVQATNYGTGANGIFMYSGIAGKFRQNIYDSGATLWVTLDSATAVADNTRFFNAMAWDARRPFFGAYVNGRRENSSTATPRTPSVRGATALGIDPSALTLKARTTMLGVWIYNRMLSDSEIAWLNAEPYSMFLPQRVTRTRAGAVLPQTVALTAASAALAGINPSVSAGAVTLTLNPATALLLAQAASRTVGAVSVGLTPAAGLVSAVTAALSGSPVTVSLTPATAALLAAVAALTPGSVTRSLAPGTLLLEAVAAELIQAGPARQYRLRVVDVNEYGLRVEQ